MERHVSRILPETRTFIGSCGFSWKDGANLRIGVETHEWASWYCSMRPITSVARKDFIYKLTKFALYLSQSSLSLHEDIPTLNMIIFGYFSVTASVVANFIACVLCACLLGLFSFAANRPPAHKKSSVRSYHDLAACRNILACKAPDNLNAPNQLSAIESRAIPNKRLVRAFGIDNTFTTQDIVYSKEFRAIAAGKLNIDDQKWNDIARAAERIVHSEVQDSNEPRMKIPLTPLLQLLSLKVALKVLFQEDPFSLDNKVVSSLAHTINELWILSKGSSPNERKMEFHQHNLRRDLVSLLPAHSLTPRETPMNFIIPAYETLWRVVLQCFVEVAFRHPSSVSTWRSVLAAYLAKPTAAQFSTRNSQSPGETASISAEDLAKESLRLYSPTRRIYRAFQLLDDAALVNVAADIERLHRDSKIWGADSRTYVPARWASASREAERAYFAFGGKDMMCPAKAGFGPRMVALLLAALVGEFGTGEWILEVDEASEGPTGNWVPPSWRLPSYLRFVSGSSRSTSSSRLLSEVMDPNRPLDSSRNAHKSLCLRRKNRFIDR